MLHWVFGGGEMIVIFLLLDIRKGLIGSSEKDGQGCTCVRDPDGGRQPKIVVFGPLSINQTQRGGHGVYGHINIMSRTAPGNNMVLSFSNGTSLLLF